MGDIVWVLWSAYTYEDTVLGGIYREEQKALADKATYEAENDEPDLHFWVTTEPVHS